MSQQDEQLDLIEELLQQLINRFQILESKVTKPTEQSTIKAPDYSQELKKLGEELARFKHTFERLPEHILKQIDNLNTKFTQTRQVSTTQQHHHHFDLRSEGFIIAAIILLLFSALSAGLSLSLWSENKLFHRQSLEYRMIRVAYPGVAVWADNTYYRDPDEAEQTTQRYEAAAVKRLSDHSVKPKEAEIKRAKKPGRQRKK